MKTISYVSLLSASASAAFLFASRFDQFAIASYAISAGAFLLLILATDYAPRPRRWQPKSAVASAVPQGKSAHSLRLAA